jgi:hypothetical protein
MKYQKALLGVLVGTGKARDVGHCVQLRQRFIFFKNCKKICSKYLLKSALALAYCRHCGIN